MSEQSAVSRYMHVIPLKRVYFGRRVNRADRAIGFVRRYVARHFKEAEKIVIDPAINNYVWSGGRRKPPRRVIVEVRFDRENKVARVFLVRQRRIRALG